MTGKDATFGTVTPFRPKARAWPRTLLLTRHAGALDWLRKQPKIDSAFEVLDHLDEVTLAPGDRVYGIFPLNLAARLCSAGVECWAIDFRIPPELRGHELTSEQLAQLDAKLVRYFVQGDS